MAQRFATEASAGPAGHGRASRRLVSVAVVAVVLALTGCAADFGAETNQIYQPAQGISDRTSGVWAIDTLVVANDRGDGTLVVALVNTAKRPDALTGVRASADGNPITVTPASLNVSLPSEQPVQFAKTGKVRLQGPAVKPGFLIHVRFSFANAAPVGFLVPVVNKTKEFASVPVGPTGQPTASPLSP